MSLVRSMKFRFSRPAIVVLVLLQVAIAPRSWRRVAASRSILP
ncbi:hypothetical protein [Leptolyngbya ohadii]|nr:hypothetical protein [Leptolyngbya ohadii]